MAIDDIQSGETGLSARNKINDALEQAGALQDVPANTLVIKGTNTLESAPAMQMADGTILFGETIQVPSASLNVEDLITLSEATGFLAITNNVDNRQYQVIDGRFDATTGSFRPNQYFLDPQEASPFVLQSIDTSVISTNPLTFNYTTTRNGQSNSLRVRSQAAMNNVRVRITDTLTGRHFKYIPNRFAWESGTGGVNLPGGDFTFSLASSPIRFDQNRQLTIEIRADEMSLQGTSTGIPYVAVDFQPAAFRGMAWLQDVEAKEDDLGNPASNGQILASTTAGTRSWISLPPTGSAFLANVLIPTGVTAGTWTVSNPSGYVLQADNTVTTIAISANPLAEDTFFFVSNPNSGAITVDLTANPASFSGFGSGQTHDVPAGQGMLFFHSTNGVSPIGTYNTGAGGGGDDHPVTLTRDTPNLASLAAIANASLNDNSGLWVVASNQVAGTESGVDSTIMIRALRSGLLDANNSEIPTTATAKSGVVLQAGTIVRIFSSTDLRVVSTPTIRESAARYPDRLTTLTAGGFLDLRANQVIYNQYRNRTAVFDLNTSGFISVYLPSLQNTADLAYLNRNDVFCFRHGGTDGEIRVRTFQVGTIFSDTTQQIVLNPGDRLCVSPAPSGSVWSILALGQNSDISLEPLVMSDWYRDGEDSTAADNSVRLHHRQNLAEGLVRDHIQSSSASNNPISLSFQHRNIQDDIAWVQWWTTWNSNVPSLGGTIPEIEANMSTALTYITDNITAGFDFDFEAPDSVLTVDSIGHVTGNEVRLVLHSAFVSSSFSVNHPVRIQGATNSVHNGTFLIDSIGTTGSNVTLHITNTGVSDNSVDESTTSAFVGVPIYARVAFISNDVRQVNFNLYSDSARTSLRTSFNADWFDHGAENSSSVLAIGYNIDIERISSQLAIQDDAGDWFVAKGGPRGSVVVFDNRTSYVSSGSYLPVSYENITIDTLGINTFYIPEIPAQLDIGETRRYRVTSMEGNGGNDVTLAVGHRGANNFVTFDEGFVAIDILPDTGHEIELYNDGSNSGVRLISPLSKTVPAAPVYATPVDATAANVDPLPISIINVIGQQNEDINGRFFNVGSTNTDALTLQANADYVFDAQVDVLFNGTEGTGLLFVPVTLMPVITRGGTPDDKEEFSHTVSLLFSRNGQSGNSAPKFSHTLRVRFEWQGQVGDQVRFDVRFGTFPAGFSASNIQARNWKWSATAQLNLN